MADLDARLAGAVMDAEARLALYDAMLDLWPDEGGNATKARCEDILNGDPVGWIGIGVLMVPDGAGWTVHERGSSPIDDAPCARVFWLRIGGQKRTWSRAKRPDCALVLASLRARNAQSK